jgi:hypothetical protein
MKKKTNEEKEKKIWINWVNPSNLGFVSWKFDNWIGKKQLRVNPELVRLTRQTRNPCHESLITK